MPPPPRSRPPPLSHTLGGTTRPILLSDTELESSSDDDDGSASSTPHVRARGLQDATQRMLDDLRSVVQGTNYCCGGTIPTENFTTSTSSAETERNTASSTTLRFDTPDGLVARIKFPNTAEIKPLSRVCSHPTFSSEGRGGLDASHFSTDFHPHDFGISDTIAQTLLPGVERLTKDEGTKKGEELWGVKTELRALNIYYPSSSSSAIKIQDTTSEKGRAEPHFGTLIICLPCPHQGGQLTLSHKSRTQTSDWSSTSPSIRWVAFHNQAALSIQPVTAGHLITLTYNLFISSPIRLPLHPTLPFADPTLYPLYTTIKTMLTDPSFLPEGGTLGFFCTNNYGHTRRNADKMFPYCLKGVDGVLFSVCNALGLKTTVKPVLGDEAWDEHYEYLVQSFMEEDGREGSVPSQQNISRIGKDFGRIKMVDVRIETGEDPTAVVNKYFPFNDVEGVEWLNEARHEGWEVQMVNLRRPNGKEGEEGEGGGLMWHYSCAAILVGVSGWEVRKGMMAVVAGRGEEEEMSG